MTIREQAPPALAEPAPGLDEFDLSQDEADAEVVSTRLFLPLIIR